MVVAQNGHKVVPPRELVQQLIRDDEKVRSLTDDGSFTVAKLAVELSAKMVDLNRDGKPEWILVSGFKMGMCGASGNCAMWVYRKTGNGYRQLLKDDSNSGASPKKSITNGYLDLVLTEHFSALETYISTYKFDGSEYQSKYCIIRSYIDKNGRRLRSPINTKC